MVTTRGRRGPTLVDEPQPISFPKQQRTGEGYQGICSSFQLYCHSVRVTVLIYNPGEANEHTASQTLESRLRKKRPNATSSTSYSANQLPKAKRQRRDVSIISPVHRKSSRPKSPTLTRKRGSQNGAVEEAVSLQIIPQDPSISAESPVAEQDKLEAVQEERSVNDPVMPASVLSRKSQPENLSIAEQFQALLEQIPEIGPCEASTLEAINQVVQYWENLSSDPVLSTSEISTELENAALPILAHVSVQILHTFASYKLKSLQQAITHPESTEGKIFAIYQKLFRIAKSPYSSRHGFIILPDAPGKTLEKNRSAIMANLATFLDACFGIDKIGSYHLHEQFWNVFKQNEVSAFQDQLHLLLMLKTQIAISAISSQERSKDLVLAEMFPEDSSSYIAAIKAENTNLSEESLTSFETQATARKQFLINHATTDEAISTLKAQHPFNEFLQFLTTFVTRHFETITGQPLLSIAPMCDNIDSMQFRSEEPFSIPSDNGIGAGDSIGNTNSANGFTAPATRFQDLTDIVHFQPPRYDYPWAQEDTTIPEKVLPITETFLELEPTPNEEDISAQAAKAAEEALLGFSQSKVHDVSEPHNHHLDKFPFPQERVQPQLSMHTQQDFQNRLLTIGSGQPYLQNHQPSPSQTQSAHYHPNVISSVFGPPPGQTQPTAVLYERARQVANSKSSNVSRSKAVSVSQRRPWSLEEEQALMDGLDQVKGPHWSQILILYGPGGSINETLRDRTQVQLKDKARNLKLFFLKSKIEVPYYLSFVTGELKSRAPGHASTLDDATPRTTVSSHNGRTDGNGTTSSATTPSRNRNSAAAATQSTSAAVFSPVLHLPRPNDTYSSPYAPIGGVLGEFSSHTNQDSPIEEDANHQDVADLATSAAAQVAAALANFNALDLPGLDLSNSMALGIDSSENTEILKVVTPESDHEDVESVTEEVSEVELEEHANAKQYSSTIANGALPESIKTFDTH